MNNKAPAAILTDQAAAMRKPLEEVMPLTRHWWCIWHIMRKIPEKLGKCDRYQDFKGVLKAVVYESLTVDEFESGWNAFIVNYKLECNEWLTGLYQERQMWVPAYMRDYFWAGMKTTQRVESINSFFDGFVNRKTKLFEFPQKYAKAMAKRVRDETAADANCEKYLRRLVTGFTVEKFFQRLYTDTKFQEVQKECTRMMYCYCKEENMLDENTIQYVVEDRVWVVPEGRSEEIITNRRRYYSAIYNRETNDVSCSCRKFVTNGIMCKHMMRILDQNCVVQIPEIYIVNRWRKDILRKHTRVRVSYHDPNKSVGVLRYNKLMGEFEGLCDEAVMLNDDAVELVSNGLRKIRSDVEKYKNGVEQESISISFREEASDSGFISSPTTTRMSTGHKPLNQTSCDIIVKDPVVNKKRRGRPKGSRQKTLAEMGYKKPGDPKKSISERKGNSKANKCTVGKAKKKIVIKGTYCKGNKSKGTAQKERGHVPNKNKSDSSMNIKGKVSKIKVRGDTKKGKGKVTNEKEELNNMSKAMRESQKVRKVKLLQDLVPVSDMVPMKLNKKRKTTTITGQTTRPSKAKIGGGN